MFTKAIIVVDNRKYVVHVSPNLGTTTNSVRNFTKMNNQGFHGSKVEEDPQKVH